MEIKVKKIAIVTYSLRVGGVENVIFSLAKAFLSQGYKVEIIETLEVGVWKSYFIKKDLIVKSIVQTPFITPLNHVNKIAKYLDDFDIILLNDTPLAQSIIGKLDESKIIFPIMHMALPIMALNASSNRGQWNKIIVVSPLLKYFLLDDQNKISDKDIIVIPNGIQIKKFNIKSRQKSKKILFLGRLSEEKGIELLPEIIDKIRDHKSFDGIDIYGSGILDEFLKNKIEEYELNDYINIKGPLSPDEVPHIIPNYDILLMPSFKEGHPIVLLESMACGVVPIVSLLKGSTDIVVNHGLNGYLCEPGNVKDFVNNLSQALEEENLKVMSKMAIQKVESEFSLQIMTDNYIKLFQNFENTITLRSNRIEKDLIGDLPYLPYIAIRPFRKTLRILGLWKY